MGPHIDEDGRFKSDKYPWLGPDEIILKLKGKGSPEYTALRMFASITLDRELGKDIHVRLDAIDAQEEQTSTGKENQ